MVTTQQEYRIAALLTALGPDVTQTVLAGLSEDQNQRIRDLLDSFQDDPLDEQELDEIVSEFHRFFQFALHQQFEEGTDEDTELTDEAGHHSATTGDTSSESVGHSSAPTPTKKSESVPLFEPTDDPIADLTRLEPYQVAGALVQENPRTIALVLNCLPPDRAGMALQQLPEDVRGPAFLALRQPPTAPMPLLHRLVRRTVEKGCLLDPSVLADPSAENNKRIADLLRVMGQNERSAMIRSLEEIDAESAAVIKRMLYLFEDIRRIHDRSIQKILAEVDSGSLAMALKGADQDLQDKILNNMSKRARATLVEEMEFLANVKPNEQAVARQAISEVMAKLDEAGDLQMD